MKGVPPGEMVYRGFYVFGENDSMGKISLKVPQIADNKDNVNFCGALFDTLSLARAFTIENHNVSGRLDDRNTFDISRQRLKVQL